MIHLLVLTAVIGFCAYLIDTYVPMSPPFKTLFRVVAVGIVIWLVLGAFGIVTPVRI